MQQIRIVYIYKYKLFITVLLFYALVQKGVLVSFDVMVYLYVDVLSSCDGSPDVSTKTPEVKLYDFQVDQGTDHHYDKREAYYHIEQYPKFDVV